MQGSNGSFLRLPEDNFGKIAIMMAKFMQKSSLILAIFTKFAEE